MNYIEQLFILAFNVTWFGSISAFASFFGIYLGIESFSIGLTMCAIIVGTKKHNTIIKKKSKKSIRKWYYYQKLISKLLINSYISHDELVLINNVLKEYDVMKKRNQKSKTFIDSSQILIDFNLFFKQYYLFAWSEEKIQKVKTQNL